MLADPSVQRRCIFCTEMKSPSEFNREHVIPEALGGRLIIYDVCTACNSELGHTVDTRLIELPTVQMARIGHGLMGGRGRHFFQHGTLADDPDQKVRVRLPPETGGETEVYFGTRVERTPSTTDPDREEISISVDKKDADKIPEMVNSMLRRKGLPEMSPEDILSHSKHGTVDIPTTRHQVSMHLFNWKPALIKIAYEYTYYCMNIHDSGEEYLNDPIAIGLRKAIKDFELDAGWFDRHPLVGEIELIDRDARSHPRLPDNVHQLILTPRDEQLWCNVRLFEQIEASLVVASHDFSRTGFVGRVGLNDVAAGTYEDFT